MKARIVNDEDWGGNYPQKWLDDNLNKVIGGQLVSQWNLTPILPDPNFIIKKWNGSVWYEGATQEEIEFENFQKLKQGVSEFITKKKTDGRSYFNEFELNITMQLVGMLFTDLVPVSKEIDSVLYKPLNFIKNGDYFSALMLFNDPETIAPTHPIVLNYWNNLKAYCIAYYNENYPTETIE